MGLFDINDKEYSIFSNNNYVMDFYNPKQWCQNCVFFGERKNSVFNLCCENYAEISIVSFCGHCNKFSDTKKINLLKQCLLKMEGFKLKNKVR